MSRLDNLWRNAYPRFQELGPVSKTMSRLQNRGSLESGADMLWAGRDQNDSFRWDVDRQRSSALRQNCQLLGVKQIFVAGAAEWITLGRLRQAGLWISFHPTVGAGGDSGQVGLHADPDHHPEDQPGPLSARGPRRPVRADPAGRGTPAALGRAP